MVHELELVLDAQATLGEGPFWDDRNNLLYWLDILGECVHVFDPDSQTDALLDK